MLGFDTQHFGKKKKKLGWQTFLPSSFTVVLSLSPHKTQNLKGEGLSLLPRLRTWRPRRGQTPDLAFCKGTCTTALWDPSFCKTSKPFSEQMCTTGQVKTRPFMNVNFHSRRPDRDPYLPNPLWLSKSGCPRSTWPLVHLDLTPPPNYFSVDGQGVSFLFYNFYVVIQFHRLWDLLSSSTPSSHLTTHGMKMQTTQLPSINFTWASLQPWDRCHFYDHLTDRVNWGSEELSFSVRIT